MRSGSTPPHSSSQQHRQTATPATISSHQKKVPVNLSIGSVSHKPISGKLIIKSEYAGLVPALSSQEYQSLKRSIKENGQYVPIIINSNNIILDGHHRFRICKELGIKPIVTKKLELNR